MSAVAAPPHRRVAPRSEAQLLQRAHEGDLLAREELVHRLLPLTKRLASRYRNGGIPREDLEQVACLGLLKAIDRYDPERGHFVSYAVPNVIGELKRHFRDKGWGMRLPRALQEHFLTVNHAMEKLSGDLGRSPTPQDVADHTALSLEEVVEALEASSAYTPAALDAPSSRVDGEGQTLSDTLGAEDPHFEFVDLGDAIAPAFRALPAREQRILGMRFIRDMTQSEIAEEMGMSQMHVSRLLRRSLDRLSACADPAALG